MLFWKKKRTPPIDLSWLHTDMHSHLIPGIDDGAKDIGASLELVKGLVNIGYKKLITTPHILWEYYPNTNKIIQQGYEQLKEAVQNEGMDIALHAAAEYFVDANFEEQLETKQPLLTISSNMVLVEISMLTAPLDLQEVLFKMQINNYQPVLAHPERYVYLTNRKSVYDDLKNSGCLFQLNLLSLTGHYGRPVQELAEYLIKMNYYDYAGTDLHHAKHIDALQKLSHSAFYYQLRSSGRLKNALL